MISKTICKFLTFSLEFQKFFSITSMILSPVIQNNFGNKIPFLLMTHSSRERKSGRLDLLFSNILLFSYLSLLTTLEIHNGDFNILFPSNSYITTTDIDLQNLSRLELDCVVLSPFSEEIATEQWCTWHYLVWWWTISQKKHLEKGQFDSTRRTFSMVQKD